MQIFKSLARVFLLIPFVLLLSSCGEKQEPVPSKPLYELTKNNNIPKFDADNAYNQIKAQVYYGPRNPNSSGHDNALNYLQNELKKYCDDVELQSFSYTGYENEKLSLTNIIGKFNPEAKHRIVLCAHWDTRPRAEKAEDPKRRNEPILGANDGGSGVGILLEVARILNTNKVNFGVDIVLFDGEDYGKEEDLDNFCLGSKFYSVNYRHTSVPAFCVLLDLVGDKDATFAKEGNSLRFAPQIVNMVWGIAKQINADKFLNKDGGYIYDDHIPLEQAGLKAIDIIDGDLIGANTPVKRRNYWHTHKDNMDNIGKNTLQQVGNVITQLLFTLKFNS